MIRHRGPECSLQKVFYSFVGLTSLITSIYVFLGRPGILRFEASLLNTSQHEYLMEGLPQKGQFLKPTPRPERSQVANETLESTKTQSVDASTSVQSPQPNSSSNQTRACARQNRHTNYTSCPQCFRLAAKDIGERLREIKYMDNLIPDERPGIFTPSKEIVERVTTEYLIVPQLKCPYLLVIQPSVLDRRHERDLVRSTWGSVAKTQSWPNRTMNAEVKVVFVVARQPPEATTTERQLTHSQPDGQSDDWKQIQSEANQHQDLLFIDMLDGYRNLTLKLVSAFTWVRDNCPCVQFVLKVDFDTFVNVPLLVDTLIYSENRLQFSILGMVYTSNNKVMRIGPWRVSESLYPMARYPEYASGCGYVLSARTLSGIVDTIAHYRMLPVEDAFITGVMRRVVGFQLFSLGSAFTHYTDKAWHPCAMLQDNKVLGLTSLPQKHQTVWGTFVQGACS
ncbi:hypothetical protein BsWGS_22989 [Bradybaena similaris]